MSTDRLTTTQFNTILSGQSEQAQTFGGSLYAKRKPKTDLGRALLMKDIAAHYHFTF